MGEGERMLIKLGSDRNAYIAEFDFDEMAYNMEIWPAYIFVYVYPI